MTLTDKISHAAERKAFETLLDNLIKKGQTQDASQVASDLIARVQRLHGDVWSEKMCIRDRMKGLSCGRSSWNDARAPK